MKKGNVIELANLLSSMKEAVKRLEEAVKKKDNEEILLAKREILNLQKQTSGII